MLRVSVQEPAADPVELTFKWSGKEFSLLMEENETIGSLKRKIQERTSVQPKRQKLLGLKNKAGKSLMQTPDAHLITDLQLKPGQKIMLLG
jgi:ubiquitin-like domain-containing CTD phosphatase 1